MAHSRTLSDLAKNPLLDEEAQQVRGSWLAERQLALHVPDSQDRVREEEINHLSRTAPVAPQRLAVPLPQVTELFGAFNRVVSLDRDARQEELQPLRDLPPLAKELETVVVLSLVAVKVRGQLQQRRWQPTLVHEVEHDKQSANSPTTVKERVDRF